MVPAWCRCDVDDGDRRFSGCRNSEVRLLNKFLMIEPNPWKKEHTSGFLAKKPNKNMNTSKPIVTSTFSSSFQF